MVSAEILHVDSTAALLGTTPKAIRQRIARRAIPFHRWGGRVVFLRGELLAFFTALEGCTPDEAAKRAQRASR